MTPEESVSRSPLHKPLYQLTEDDIAQLTREDCRKFLKDKGMRRPSWNKSQAIEQVISLKNLLEPRPETESNAAAPRPRVQLSRPENNSNQVSPNEKRKDSTKSGNVSVSVPDTSVDKNNTSPRNKNSINGLIAQMTIFYCGKVSVYDDMPADKALAIMQLAASHNNLPQDSPPAGVAALQPFAYQFQAAPIRPALALTSASPPSIQNVVAESSQQCREEVTCPHEGDSEGPVSRKASVQRYLEKRKDRCRFKNKRKLEMSSSLQLFVNQQLRDQSINEQPSLGIACSPPQQRLPPIPTFCSSIENQAKNIPLSIDLNDNGAQEA